jgi:serine/threonine protein kinase
MLETEVTRTFTATLVASTPGPLRDVRMSTLAESAEGKYAGLAIDLFGLGKVQLTRLVKEGAETSIYRCTHPGVVVKTFDLSCSKAGEISYGPYLRFTLELANFEDIMKIESLKGIIPAYYGANINYEEQYAWIAMEYLLGENLQTWCDEASNNNFPPQWIEELKAAVYQTLAIMTRFHRHEIILVDFKPENVIRLPNGGIRIVDLGAFFTPRQQQATEKYLYSATPDYSELLIDASHIETGIPITEAADIFSAGVALFQMATGVSRLVIQEQTADEILRAPEIYRFRDSQIRDLWHEYPHIKPELPLVEMQLRSRELLFAELWHLLKGYLGKQVPGWESLEVEQRDQILLTTGTTFIQEQLPTEMQWLAGPIASSTVLRSIRLKSVSELMRLLATPLAEELRLALEKENALVKCLRDQDRPLDFLSRLNTWDVRLDSESNCWGIVASIASPAIREDSQYTFVRKVHTDPWGNRFYHLSDDMEADDFQNGKLTVWDLRDDPQAWLL